MPADPDRTAEDHRLAHQLATRAGELLLELRARAADDLAADAATLRAEGDRLSNELLLRQLAEHRPDDAVLSEEAKDDGRRFGCPRVWIVDPLDGTREFGELDRTDWAVHVALVEDGRLTVGAVALPAQGVTLSTAEVPVVGERAPGPPRVLVSRSRPPSFARELADRIGGELVPLGSAGAKAMAVVQGGADVYAHAGGQYEWDSAAPVAVATTAGLWTSRIDGRPLVYNSPDPWLPDVLICRQELAEQVRGAFEAMGSLSPD